MYSNIGSFSRMSNFCGRRYCSWFKVQTKIWILKRFCQLMFTTYHKKINSFLNGRPIRKQDLKIWIYFFVVSTYLLTVVCILVGIMYCLFLHHGWFVQNLGKDFIPTNMHRTVLTLKETDCLNNSGSSLMLSSFNSV